MRLRRMARHSGPRDRSAQVPERPVITALCRAVWGLRGQSKSPEAHRWTAAAVGSLRGSGGLRHAIAMTRTAGAHGVVARSAPVAAERRGCFGEKPSRRVCHECRRHRMYSLHWPRCIADTAAIPYSESFSYGNVSGGCCSQTETRRGGLRDGVSLLAPVAGTRHPHPLRISVVSTRLARRRRRVCAVVIGNGYHVPVHVER